MKKAIGYIRISDKDQSNFSIPGQEKYIREYCERHNLHLHSIFTDEKSAKDFDRKAWQKLEDFMHTSYRDVDYLIVIKYDRFSRNAAAGLNKIEMIEKKYRIIVVSVFEQMSIDYDSPFYFKQRADMLVNAEFELRVIRDRTLFGMHEALSSGRYVSKAPTGYLNTRDIYNKPFIVIDKDKGPIIRRMFEMYLQGAPLKAISDYAVSNGFPLRGNSAITRVLTNPVYAGLVRVPAYKYSPEKVIPGIHDPLISTGDFWDIQVRLGVIKQPHTVQNEAVPLRGVLKCFCGKPLTAGNSKGKKNYYWYYKCMDHLKFNLSAIKLHKQFDDLLDNLSLDPVYLDYLRQSANRQMKEEVKLKSVRLSSVLYDLDSVTDKLESLEEKYINNAINPETYQKWHGKLKRSESTLKYEKETLQEDRREYWKLYEEQLPKLSDIKAIYNMATITQKQVFIKAVFKSDLRYQDGVYRTPYLLEMFQPKAALLKEKRLLNFEKPLQISGFTPVCAPGGT